MLKVRFDGKMTHSIMQEERGAALRLLYQLKLAIQKREGPPPDAGEQCDFIYAMHVLPCGIIENCFSSEVPHLITLNQYIAHDVVAKSRIA